MKEPLRELRMGLIHHSRRGDPQDIRDQGNGHGTEDDANSIQYGFSTQYRHAGRESEESHQHPQAAARLHNAQLDVMNHDRVAFANSGLPQNLKQERAPPTREGLKGPAEHRLQPIRQRDHEEQEGDGGPGGSERRSTAQAKHDRGQAREEGDGVEPEEDKRSTEHAKDQTDRKDDQPPTPRGVPALPTITTQPEKVG